MPPAVHVYPALRRLLFALDPETSHGLGLSALRAASVLPRRSSPGEPALRQTLFGREFANPLGLAAGFDKNAVAVRAWAALGFGFVEVGTVTPRAQPGNPRPRLFRHPAEESLQNALGFNNGGMDALRRRLSRLYPLPFPLGVNVGKNKDTPQDKALEDYEILIRGLHGLCDYLVVNLSSPNTPGLRDLQNEAFLRAVLGLATEITDKPVLVKIAPDMEPADAVTLSQVAVDAGAAGVVATNTTVDYSLVANPKNFGGISGR
ncbi:MAG TPA: dihydroorotate dehydrogenase (quinone), partial [Thermoanaerobaculia bacterium]|nr:dihydroorotate dehydrogenase (quinone) [Thermoanaerobaculia bacterium]